MAMGLKHTAQRPFQSDKPTLLRRRGRRSSLLKSADASLHAIEDGVHEPTTAPRFVT